MCGPVAGALVGSRPDIANVPRPPQGAAADPVRGTINTITSDRAPPRRPARLVPRPPVAMRSGRMLPRTCLLLVIPLATLSSARAGEAKPPAAGPVSYYKQVRPIFQANCQG